MRSIKKASAGFTSRNFMTPEVTGSACAEPGGAYLRDRSSLEPIYSMKGRIHDGI
jgi:hypothetical protein